MKTYRAKQVRYPAMKILWGNRKTTAAVLLAMLFLAAACLSACGDSGDMFVRIPEETLPAGTQNRQEDSAEASDTATDTAEAPPSDVTPTEKESVSPEETPVPAAGKQPETTVPEEGGGEQTPAANTVPHTTSGSHELNGSIQSVGDAGFTVYRITTAQQDDGGMIAYSSKEENTLVDISFTDQTVFTITSSADGGITSSSTPGTKADLEVSRTVYMTGQWEGNLFRADTVVIYHFS